MKVAVIGAGAAGLISAKYLADAGIDFDVFEGNDQVGGTWIYSDNFIDKHGLPVSTSMYKNLKTNLPKELMLFNGLDYDVQDESFIPASDVLEYLKQFSRKFNLETKIKFEQLVKKVSRKDESWEVTVKNLNSDVEYIYIYDSIFVCNGHYAIPSYQEIPGSESFPGSAIHSHFYRTTEPYKDKIVLITGLGPSAVDITFDLSPSSKLIYMSHHGPDFIKDKFPENVIHKPDVKCINGRSIQFLDGSEVQVEAIIYCTGYMYDFPFLDDNCGIKMDNNYVHPLYKQFISIPHNTMFLIGIPFRSFIFPMLELQVRCAINILTGKVKLPGKSEMEADMLQWEQSLASKGVSKNKYHCITECVKQYFHELVEIGNLDPCPEVLFGIFAAVNMIRKTELATYRNRVFTIIDSDTFSYR